MQEVQDQVILPCGCHCQNSSVYAHSGATICGKRFHAGESLRLGRRCGSVVTSVFGGRSRYGLVRKFFRVFCLCRRVYDFSLVSWLPYPVYPDGNPLTVVIDVGVRGVNYYLRDGGSVLSLYDIQPSRVLVEIDPPRILVMRMEGLDTLPGPPLP